MEFITIFIIVNILNVMIQTAKSIVTIRCGKIAAALVNALAYGLYTYLLVLINGDLGIWVKIGVVAGANLIGVYTVKYIEEKKEKIKLWKIEFTIPARQRDGLIRELMHYQINYNYFEIGRQQVSFTCVTENKQQSRNLRELLHRYECKYFVTVQNGVL